MGPSERSIPAAIALFFTAPLVAVFFLGNLSRSALPGLLALAPMYGAGALLIRELMRRYGRGWTGIFLLGAACALFEEGFITQSLFNPASLSPQLHLFDRTWIPVLHISLRRTLFVFNLHTFWGIAVSVALVEAIMPAHARAPWLSRTGDCLAGLGFAGGCVLAGLFTMHHTPFVASPLQFLVAGLGCLALTALAFRLAPARTKRAVGPAPIPWFTGAVAFLLGAAVLMMSHDHSWEAAALIIAVDTVFFIIVSSLSRRGQWTALHTLSLAAGGVFALGLHALIAHPPLGEEGLLVRLASLLFLAGVVPAVLAAVRRTSRFLATHRQPLYRQSLTANR